MTTPITPSTVPTASTKEPTGLMKSELYTVDVGGFGIAEMMNWLAATMAKSDGAIRAQMAEISGAKELAAKLGAVITELKNAEATSPTETGRDMTAAAATLNSMVGQPWFDNLPSATKNALLRLKEDSGSDVLADARVVQAAREALVDYAGTLTSANDIAMVKLQSAVAARGQAIQLISNMMNSFNDTSNRIIGNLK